MGKKQKQQDNFLDLIPVRSSKIRWVTLENEIVQIQIDRNSWLDKAVRLFFKTPTMMKIDLDPYGSFVWKAIDGTRTIESIAGDFKSAFGDEVEPLYERLGSYVNILRNNEFIKLEKKSEECNN